MSGYVLARSEGASLLNLSSGLEPPSVLNLPWYIVLLLSPSLLYSQRTKEPVYTNVDARYVPVSCVNRGWGLWYVYHCIGRAAWSVCERSSAPRAAKSLFTRGKKGGQAAQCLLMMTNLAADVTLIILPVLPAHARDDDSGNVIQSIHWFYLCDLRCYLRRLCHCLMTATFKALLSRSFLLASLDKRVVN